MSSSFLHNARILPVSVIIPTCNRSDDLLKTINSILSSPSVPNEIIIVDQSDEYIALEVQTGMNKICQTIDNEIKINLQKATEKSLTKSRNIGMDLAKNEIIIFCDDDILIFNDTIGETYKIMSNNQYLMCGALDKNTLCSKSKAKIFLSCLIARKEWKQRYIGCVTKSIYGSYPYKNLDKETDTRWAMGYYFSINKNFAKAHNLSFDENLSTYGYAEDLDFTFRYWQHAILDGKKCVLSPNVAVYHLASLKNRLTTRDLYVKECVNRLYLSYKLFSQDKSSRWAYRWANFCTGLRLFFKPKKFLMWKSACKVASKHKRYLKKGIINASCYK